MPPSSAQFSTNLKHAGLNLNSHKTEDYGTITWLQKKNMTIQLGVSQVSFMTLLIKNTVCYLYSSLTGTHYSPVLISSIVNLWICEIVNGDLVFISPLVQIFVCVIINWYGALQLRKGIDLVKLIYFTYILYLIYLHKYMKSQTN